MSKIVKRSTVRAYALFLIEALKMFVIQTRFSLFNKNINSELWRIGRGQPADFMAALMDEDRLRTRCKIFFENSLPLLNRAFEEGHDIVHLALHSNSLPEWVLEKLQDSKSRYSWFVPLGFSFDDDFSFYEPIKNVVRERSNNRVGVVVCAGIRLDDDDLLGPKYFSKLTPYMQPAFDGFCISMPRGISGEWSDNAFVRMAAFYEPKCALGLAQIFSFDVPNAQFTKPYLLPPGAHTSVDERVPTVLDATGDPIFVRTFHSSNDIFANRDGVESAKYLNRMLENIVEFDINVDL